MKDCIRLQSSLGPRGNYAPNFSIYRLGMCPSVGRIYTDWDDDVTFTIPVLIVNLLNCVQMQSHKQSSDFDGPLTKGRTDMKILF